jgi:large subunit ribosomal protein L18
MSNATIEKNQKLQRRRARIRSRIAGTAQRPRLSVKITQMHVVAQLIDDTNGRTLAYVSTVASKAKGTMAERAAWAGDQIATGAKSKKIKQVVFDRGGRLYHGRLHALAEAARKGGLEF